MSLMDVIHKPQTPVQAGSDAQSAGASKPAKPAKRKKPRQPVPVPMLLMGSMVVFSVGFGAGSVSQFDTDWKAGAPQAVETFTGTLPADAELPVAIEQLLSDATLPVTAVECGTTSAVASAATSTTMCRGRADDRMVNVLAETTGQAVTLTVYSAA